MHNNYRENKISSSHLPEYYAIQFQYANLLARKNNSPVAYKNNILYVIVILLSGAFNIKYLFADNRRSNLIIL